jgi:hypothetical protein
MRFLVRDRTRFVFHYQKHSHNPTTSKFFTVLVRTAFFHIRIQGVSEIRVLILTGNRTRQKEQLFYLPFCRKTMFNSKKKLERFFTKIALRH